MNRFIITEFFIIFIDLFKKILFKTFLIDTRNKSDYDYSLLFFTKFDQYISYSMIEGSRNW